MRGKVLFLSSHLGSGYDEFGRFLDENPRIQGYESKGFYDHPDKVLYLKEQRHKNDTAAAIHMTKLIWNQQLQSKYLLDFCYFLYLVREPHYSLSSIVREGYNEKTALRYYTTRLQRITQMAKLTKGAVFLTWESLTRAEGYGDIEEYLGLAQPLREKKFKASEIERTVSLQIIEEGHKIYAKYLQQVSKIDHLKSHL